MLRLVFFDEVAERLHLSRRTLRRMWQAGEMPEPIRISPRRLAWRADELAAWLNSRRQTEPAEPAETTQEVIQ